MLTNIRISLNAVHSLDAGGLQNVDWFRLAKKLGIGALILFFGFILVRLICNTLERFMLKKQVRRSVCRLAISVLKALLYFTIIIAFADQIGLQTTSLIALLGSVGLAIGLALQGSLGDLASGILLVVLHPFQSGDFVFLGDNRAELLEVVEIRLFHSIFRNRRGYRVIVPNSNLTKNFVVNLSVEEEVMVEVPFAVSYDACLDKTREAVLSAMDQLSQISSEGRVVAVSKLGTDGIEFIARGKVAIGDYLSTGSALAIEIKKALDAAEIEIPFPQLDLHLRKNELKLIDEE
ncbi:MAG: mechanosensitive ion channel [Eubacteriales bacterium]|nr:mechanosensitive ion channel [Eubacteriales bacterium]